MSLVDQIRALAETDDQASFGTTSGWWRKRVAELAPEAERLQAENAQGFPVARIWAATAQTLSAENEEFRLVLADVLRIVDSDAIRWERVKGGTDHPALRAARILCAGAE
jgi:hypothetical protein